MLVQKSRLGTKTFPDPPDSWSESLTPAEGSWSRSEGDILNLTTYRVEGNYSIHLEGDLPAEVLFTLHDGYEFDGTQQDARLHCFLAMYGDTLGNAYPGLITLYDINGRKAYIDLDFPNDGEWYPHTFNLGAGTPWIEDLGFDWRFIKQIKFDIIRMFVWLPGYGHLFIDQLYFSFYQLEPAFLNVLSDPTGKQFRYDSNYDVTPRYTIGLMPYTDYEIAVEEPDFKEWENGDLTPIRTINLGEGEEKTITAYYVFAPPPPGKGTLICRAYLNSEEINVTVAIEGVESDLTPFEKDLDPGSYNLKAVYEDQVIKKTATIVEGEIVEEIFKFKAKEEDYGLVIGLGIVATFLAGTLIYSSLT